MEITKLFKNSGWPLWASVGKSDSSVTFDMQRVTALSFESWNDNAMFEALWNLFQLADMIVDLTQPVLKDWTTVLEMLW